LASEPPHIAFAFMKRFFRVVLMRVRIIFDASSTRAFSEDEGVASCLASARVSRISMGYYVVENI
jgi:hypothetical protein